MTHSHPNGNLPWSANMLVAIASQSSLVTDNEAAAMTQDIVSQIPLDVAPRWDRAPAAVIFNTDAAAIPPNAHVITLTDTSRYSAPSYAVNGILLTAPLGILNGGYAVYAKAGKEQQKFGDVFPQWRRDMKLGPYARTRRRKAQATALEQG